MASGLAVIIVAASPPLVRERLWLERLALLIPGPAATRWLLIGDAVCLIAIGLASRGPWVGVPLALAFGFLALNALGMVMTDFYLGLALFHLVVGVTAVIIMRRARWIGVVQLALALALGVAT